MDFAHDYMRALLAKEIDVAAELQKQRSQVVYQQYCAGGTMHRGYYCPSLTEDLWLGNTKRGRLCKKRPPEERLSHIYGFDASDRLITVKHMHCLIDNWYREAAVAGTWIHEHSRYVFSVEDGYLGDYTAENFYYGRCGVKIPYRVTKKRKVPPCTPENR